MSHSQIVRIHTQSEIGTLLSHLSYFPKSPNVRNPNSFSSLFWTFTVFTQYFSLVFGCCWLYNTSFTITDLIHNKLFAAKEDSDCMMRFCYGSKRALKMAVTLSEDPSLEVLTFDRAFNCQGCSSKCCYPSCMQVSIFSKNLIFH